MKIHKSIWRSLDDILKDKGPGPFSDYLITAAIERGEKLEKMIRLIEKYESALRHGDQIIFVRKAIFDLNTELNA